MAKPLEKEIEVIRQKLNYSCPQSYEKNYTQKPKVYAVSVKLDRLIVEYMKKE